MTDEPTRREVVFGAVASTAVPNPLLEEGHRDLMMGFCSLGNNCEFGQAQRVFKAEPIDLFRWSSTPYKILMTLLERRFDNIGDPDKIVINETPQGEYMVRNTEYNFGWHAFANRTNAEPKALHEREVKRLPFLARKLMEDIHDAERIFVIKTTPWLALDKLEAAHILQLMDLYGGQPTLMFVHDGAETVHIERLAPRLLHGHIKQFADQTNIPGTTPSTDWLGLCQAALTCF